MERAQIAELLDSYDKKDITIATATSHSALQIFHAAKKEGFKTLGVCDSAAREKAYSSFKASTPDSFLRVDSWKDLLSRDVQERLVEENTIVIPHGSFVEYVGSDEILEKFKVPMFGNREVLNWESKRAKQREWLEKLSGLHMPREFDPSNIKALSLVKASGAKGGKGFFKVKSSAEFYEQIQKRLDSGEYSKEDIKHITIQEYIPGARYYFHFFYSPLSSDSWAMELNGKGIGSLELTGIDRRDETNIDDLHRTGLDASELKELGITPTYTVAGNLPLVLRESLLPKVFELGEKVVKSSVESFSPGVVGPFCLETFCTSRLDFITFEISARIVAGTNLYPAGSPYSVLAHGADAEMSAARRLMLEVRKGIELGRLPEIVY